MIIVLFLLSNFLTGASAVFEKDLTKITIKKDHHWEVTKEIVLHIISYRGREKFGNLMERYNKEEAKVEVLTAKTISPEGRSFDVEKKAIGDLSTVEALLAPKYTKSRMKTIAFSRVEDGARIIFKIRKVGRKKRKFFCGRKVFQKDEPVIHSELDITSPIPLYFYTIGPVTIDSTVDKRRNFYHYRFSCDSLPRVKEEPARVDIDEISPRVYFSSFTNWSEVADWLREKFYSAVKAKGDLARKAMELTSNLGRKEKIEKIYDLVTRDWRDVPLTIKEAGFEPTPTEEVYRQRYGDNKDKCLLLISMLRAVGINAYPGYVARELIKGLPSLEYFDHMVAVVDLPSGQLFLDPSIPEQVKIKAGIHSILNGFNQGFPLLPDLTGRYVLIVTLDTFKFAKISNPIPADFTSKLSFDISIDSSGAISASLNASLTGIPAIRIRSIYKDKTQPERKIKLEEVLSRIKTGTKLLDWQIENLNEPRKKVTISAKFYSPDYGVIEGNRMRISLFPWLCLDDFSSYFSVDQREYTLDAISPRCYRYRFMISLPKGYQPYYLPDSLTESDSLITLRIITHSSSNSVTIVKEIEFKKRFYSSEEYSHLFELWSQFYRPETNLIIVKRD
ncbi:hypothetical protein DRP53_10850 [candidate division WOR-3 bacterium]|uniref:DUF3857 domain-containing protein n=1 Tax=candidate division WOR-3 bacterium TaxID=2052148 RepID=A0A660SCL2_UNCW3|nr:MAG: hypothetical protein DRP53_10850 [candidate division WOR-3 bacterium]